MPMPMFSIITPTYKRPLLLKRAVDSVLSQSFRDFELIVVDDDPDGSSAAIMRSYNDHRIVTLGHEVNRGAAAAYNTGIRKARGAFISFLDDDDEYLPSFLEKTRAFWETPAAQKLGFVWTGIQRVKDTPGGEVLWYERIWPATFASSAAGVIEATSIGNGFGLTVRRECLDEIGLFDPTFGVSEDTELMFRLASHFDFATIPEPLVKIHHHQCPQLTDHTNYPIRVSCYEKIMDRHTAFLERYPGLFYVHHLNMVNLSYLAGLKRKGREIMGKIIRRNPCRVMGYLDWCCYELFGKNALSTIHDSGIGKILKPFLGR